MTDEHLRHWLRRAYPLVDAEGIDRAVASVRRIEAERGVPAEKILDGIEGGDGSTLEVPDVAKQFVPLRDDRGVQLALLVLLSIGFVALVFGTWGRW